MKLTSSIAKRYLFSKNSTNAINLITGIAMFGITIGTTAIILIMSVFNGFQTLIVSFLDGFNPDLKVVPIEGKYFSVDDQQLLELKNIEGLIEVSKALEEVVLFEYNDQQEAGTLKGVDQHFNKVTTIDSTIKQGRFVLESEGVPMSVVGKGMALKLSINIYDPFSKLVIYSPNTKKKGFMSKDFKSLPISIGGVFSMQTENDYQYVLCPFDFVEKLGDLYGKTSSLEIKIDPKANQSALKEKIMAVFPDQKLEVKDRYQQDESHTKIMSIEKWLAFLIVSLTLLLVAFNLVGSLWMIVLDKKKDIATLSHLGMTDHHLRMIFLKEGLLITGLGVFIGFALALIVYWLQIRFGIVSMSDGFVVDSYPINLRFFDFVAVFCMVVVIGFIASYAPSMKAANMKHVAQ